MIEMGRQVFNGRRGQHFYADPDRVSVIGLAGGEGEGPYDTAHVRGEHPLWDERVADPVDEPLVRNIRAYGLIESVKVRKAGRYPDEHPLAGEDVIEVIEGRQRTRACRVAVRRALAAGEVAPRLKIEFMASDDETAVGVMISANEQRRADAASTRARKAARVLGLGHALGDVAVMFGVTVRTIRQWERFISLAPRVVRSVDAGSISMTGALKLHGLDREAQHAALDELLSSPPTGQGGGGGSVAPPTRPRTILTRKTLRRLASDEEFLGGLGADARAILDVLLGDAAAVERVPGLTDRLSHKRKRGQQ